MIKISHRGNVHGPNPALENHPDYILQAIQWGFDVEIDLWYVNEQYFLGHDEPQYSIHFEFLQHPKLWVHCKNTEAVVQLHGSNIHYFWHENDTLTLTSKGFIWAFPGKQPIKSSIAVMPELYQDSLESCIGICSDFVGKY